MANHHPADRQQGVNEDPYERIRQLERDVADLSMFVRRLARRLTLRSKTSGDTKAAESAVGFLARHGQQGSPREDQDA